jgi:hypothetical protein
VSDPRRTVSQPCQYHPVVAVARHAMAMRKNLTRLEKNPFSYTKFGGKVVRSNTVTFRDAFTIDELNRFYASPVYTQGDRPRKGGGEAAYWLPLLAQHTGARVEDLCRLQADDLVQREGVWCFHLHDTKREPVCRKSACAAGQSTVRVAAQYIWIKHAVLFQQTPNCQAAHPEEFSASYLRRPVLRDEFQQLHSQDQLMKQIFLSVLVPLMSCAGIQAYAAPSPVAPGTEKQKDVRFITLKDAVDRDDAELSIFEDKENGNVVYIVRYNHDVSVSVVPKH